MMYEIKWRLKKSSYFRYTRIYAADESTAIATFLRYNRPLPIEFDYKIYKEEKVTGFLNKLKVLFNIVEEL